MTVSTIMGRQLPSQDPREQQLLGGNELLTRGRRQVTHPTHPPLTHPHTIDDGGGCWLLVGPLSSLSRGSKQSDNCQRTWNIWGAVVIEAKIWRNISLPSTYCPKCANENWSFFNLGTFQPKLVLMLFWILCHFQPFIFEGKFFHVNFHNI